MGRIADSQNVRNFSIIAHIDHGKSTLADRLIELTNAVPKRELREQFLDQMDLERERGITIKLQPIHMVHDGHVLNLIDTPGHVDFSYEVSRSLAACEGAIILVDATQGAQAQTVAHLRTAQALGLAIVPVMNKIDLPNADRERTVNDLVRLTGCSPKDVLGVSAKTGEGIPELLRAVIERIPAPIGKAIEPLRALIFDSQYDAYRGVVAYLRVVDGSIRKGTSLAFLATGAAGEALEVGCFRPSREATEQLCAGDIGYVVTSLKDIRRVAVGDTITDARLEAVPPLKGYQRMAPMVFAGLYPKGGGDARKLREAALALRLNDAAFVFEPEHSPAFGFGLRCGFLGLLHLDITVERLRREFGVATTVTAPSVRYSVRLRDGSSVTVDNPVRFPDPALIEEVREPWIAGMVLTTPATIGKVMELIERERGVFGTVEYLDAGRVVLSVELPLTRLLTGFYDTLKSISAGYASLSYDVRGSRPCAVEKLTILVAGEPVEPLATIVYRDERDRVARSIVEALKERVPPALFEIRIQAAVGGTIIASARISPMRKDVTAKLYGGDVTRKMKLLEKQRKGKKRLRAHGAVDLPPEVYRAVLTR